MRTALPVKVLIAAAFLSIATAAEAQLPPEPESAPAVPIPLNTAQPAPVSKVTTKSHEFVIAPIPMQNPSQGWGLAVITQLIFHHQQEESGNPPSIIGAGGFYTEKESYGFGAAFLGSHRGDSWRTTIGAGYGNIHYEFFGVGNDDAKKDKGIPIQQEFEGGIAQVLRRVRPHLYLGARLTGGKSKLVIAPNRPADTIPAKDHDFSLFGAGLVLQHDSRDDIFYPVEGTLLYVRADAFDGGGIASFTHQSYEAEGNQYKTVGEKNVLATRGFVKYVTDGAPVFELCQFGAHNDLRGYLVGKYRDHFMVAAQTELRRELRGRFGAVIFGGVGEVAPDPGALDTENLLWSAGAGVRFRLTKDNKINFRLDWAWGKDGSAYYLGVGEAF
jgi:outer membrane protein assembly factor BamA